MSCGGRDWLCIEVSAPDISAMTELKCSTCRAVALYADLVVQPPIELELLAGAA
jgi:hypothetical protein